jgi:hypothetical protein
MHSGYAGHSLKNALPSNQDSARETENLHEDEVALQYRLLAETHEIPLISTVLLRASLLNSRVDGFSLRSTFKFYHGGLVGYRCRNALRRFAILLLISLRDQFEVPQQSWLGWVSTLHTVRPRRCILSVLGKYFDYSVTQYVHTCWGSGSLAT